LKPFISINNQECLEENTHIEIGLASLVYEPTPFCKTSYLKMIEKERYTWHVKIELNTLVSQNVASTCLIWDITFSTSGRSSDLFSVCSYITQRPYVVYELS
jgi:hypothetical protein